jgi:hypothetical protein
MTLFSTFFISYTSEFLMGFLLSIKWNATPKDDINCINKFSYPQS